MGSAVGLFGLVIPMFISWTEIVLSGIYLVTLYFTLFWLLCTLEESSERRKRLRRLPSVTVAIPAFNEESTLARSVESVLGLDYPAGKVQLIVVNDGSTDGTAAEMERIVRAHRSRNVIALHQPNQGKYRALNRALGQAAGEFFVCLDADSVVRPDALRKMLPRFTDSRVGVVIPMMKVESPRNLLQKVQWYEYIINKFYNTLISRLNCLHVAPGPFSVYRAGVLRKLGGFRKGHNTEDLEIALRLQQRHYRIVQVADAEVTTVSPMNLAELYAQRSRWNKGSFLNVLDYRRMLFNRAYGDFGMFYLPLVLFSGVLVSALVALTLYYQLAKPLFKMLYNLSLVNFDVLTYLRNLTFSISWLDMDYYKIALMLFVLGITAVVVILAHQVARESVGGQGFVSLAVAIMLYYLFLGAVWVGVFKDLVFQKWQRW